MNKVKKYPVTKDGVDYTVKIREKTECYDGWDNTFYLVKIYKGNSYYFWDKVYEIILNYTYTPKEAVEVAMKKYQHQLDKINLEQLKWQELIDWDGNMDNTN